MSRSVPYRRQINEIVNWNQIKAANETFFILREIGPVGFIVQEEGHEKKYKVCLGDPHSCSCKEFKKEKDLCKHICWTLLKRFRVDKDDPISWQLGLNEREINDLIFSKNLKKVTTAKTTTVNNEENPAENTVSQRKIETDDICPICQDDLLNRQKPVTFCRNGCGNNIHIRCMAVWTEHKKKELNMKMQDSVPCPICRGEFGTLHLLMVEMNNSKSIKVPKSKVILQVKQVGLNCSNCKVTPIIGKAYKCNSCAQFYLCGICFNNCIHSQHEFSFREHSNGKWISAPNSRGLPLSLVNGLQNSDLESVDYTLLQQLDKPGEGSNLRQHDLNQFSTWNITTKSKLSQPGHQCRICLMSYKAGDTVRKLPRCQHIFHTHCIDPWLLHRTASCPIDEIEVCKLSLNTSSHHQKSHHVSVSLINQNNSHSFHNQIYNENSRRPNAIQTNDLSSALSIASLNCRPSSTSDLQKYNLTSPGNLVRSAMHKPSHLPPLSKPTNHQFDSSFSITSFKPQKHFNQE